jgi:hypothetical protein
MRHRPIVADHRMIDWRALIGRKPLQPLPPMTTGESPIESTESPIGHRQMESARAPQLLRRVPKWHAEHFLDWLRRSDWPASDAAIGIAKFTAGDIQAAYREFCADQGIEQPISID